MRPRFGIVNPGPSASRAIRSASSRCLSPSSRVASRLDRRSQPFAKSLAIAFDIDERGVHDFFCFGHVLGPRSIFRQIRSVPPGHVLAPVGEAVLQRFWSRRFKWCAAVAKATG